MITMITAIAKYVGLKPALLVALCSSETDFRHLIVPDDGGSPSYGVCQVKLTTAEMFDTDVTKERIMIKPFNIYYAAMYLKHQLDRYDGDLVCAIASYNMGRCKKNSKGEVLNKNYVRKVLRRYAEYQYDLKSNGEGMDSVKSRQSVKGLVQAGLGGACSILRRACH